ncbi:MAG: ELM1/GtrOC1 family putative glycosyltransferase [Candidatus Omnitrophica bacterium]|nr:ELM1/GtrOC1 family putative glycosyltransferase [Candidatus Omnitrophota bacterium]MDD5573920.1 ELM1/GtrOC1 family putative glycosyltransferase [Candidatus Omnitrophota bacterium]
MLESVLYVILKAWMRLARFLPLGFLLAAGRAAGSLYYFWDVEKARRAANHIKMALPGKTPRERRRIVYAMYRNFAQNIVETLYLPYIDEAFVRRHVTIPRWDVFLKAQETGRGVIFLGCHAGSWELSNIACALLIGGNRYAMLARPQGRTKKIDAFLNGLRASKGCAVIRVNELKKMVEHLVHNNVLGAVADHGGKDGVEVPFFGKTAKTPTGSVKLARKLGASIVLAFVRRKRGADHELLLEAFHPVAEGEEDAVLAADLTAINAVFEKWIRLYPEEYLWFFKRWKYSSQRRVLILSDGKAGHVKQSLALADMIRDTGRQVEICVSEIRFRTGSAAHWLSVLARLFGASAACLSLRFFLEPQAYKDVEGKAFDVVISAGSRLSAVNIALARDNDAVSIAIMKPGLLRYSQLGLVVMPEHDRPVKRGNVLAVPGSLSSVSPESMRRDYEMLLVRRPALKTAEHVKGPKVGFLIGGDSKYYALTEAFVGELAGQMDRVLKEAGGALFVTTSRRTPQAAVRILRPRLEPQDGCKLFVDAAEDNPEGTVGGILHASDVVVVTGESISMVSEAAASGKYIVVCEPERLVEHNKVRRFLEKMQSHRYIYLVKSHEIYDKLSWIIKTQPLRVKMDARAGVVEALKKLV